MCWNTELRFPIVSDGQPGRGALSFIGARNARAVFVLPLVLAMAGWLSASYGEDKVPDFIEIGDGAYVLSKPDPLAEFRLLRHDNTPFRNSSLVGTWTFLFFGYTSCPDICPTTLMSLKQVRRELVSQQPGGARDVQFVFVSIDPQRDTPERLSEYIEFFDPAFIGVTGDSREIARLSESVGVVYARVPGSAEDDYFMDHSSALLLADPEGRLHAVFAAPHVPSQIVHAYGEIRARAAGGK